MWPWLVSWFSKVPIDAAIQKAVSIIVAAGKFKAKLSPQTLDWLRMALLDAYQALGGGTTTEAEHLAGLKYCHLVEKSGPPPQSTVMACAPPLKTLGT